MVDGKCLVVASGTVLPAVCVKTNQPVSQEDLVEKRFYWCSPIVGLLIVVSGLLLMLVYFVARRKCLLTFGLQPKLRRKYRRRVIVKTVAVIGLFFAIPVSAESEVLMLTVLVLFLIAVVSLFFGNSPLSVVKYRDKAFWIAGFSEEYLAEMRLRSAASPP